MRPQKKSSEQPLLSILRQGNAHASLLHFIDPSTRKSVKHAPQIKDSQKNTPLWQRPFSSLRMQLMFTNSLILTLVVILICTLIYQRLSSLSITLIALSIILLGVLLIFVLTTLLLRPLWRVTDVAQAIAIGDLKQRERLPLRLPPQDEVDRLAGSLSEMVTRLEHAEEMQRASEQHFRRFFADASHQLRTPLTSIRGFTEVLLRGAKDDPETATRVLKRMKSESERMTYLINDILTLARLGEQAELKTQYIHLMDLANEEFVHIQERAQDGRQIMLTVLTHEHMGLQADKERLKQLLFILLDNALRHGKAGPDGIITLQLDKSDNQAIIRVRDNGAGINEEDIAHIFDSFYRGRQPTANGMPVVTGSTGSGLGLAIAAAIAHAHKGTISVESMPGMDTVFTIMLPCLD